ncbi:MAG TPA: efflux RND transporter periplasmic adaptor subunit [Burkholderiaceae bacterium]|nr:efflux RND transporter periplasmic adaptor subunit [Burkholderiaceae bacterium]HQR69727.1 efflux RND transporter periplasmic adaptor subunit [Burkholderiaceae bacterium]
MKHRVTIIAIGVLAVVAAAAYVARDAYAPGPSAVGARGEVKGEVAGAARSDAKAPGKNGPAGPTPVEVVRLMPTVVKEDLQAVGSLRSNESVILRPEVSGRIAAIGFRDGQIVRKGQLLVALDATLNEAEVAQAQAEYDLALSNLRRSEDLASRKFISSSAQETATSNAQVAEARLKLAQARLSKMRIVAPFDGAVGIRSVSLGDYVKDGTDLVNIEDVRVLKVDFRLPERNFTQIHVGQAVEVVADALPGERWQGQIEAINPKVDANGRSLEIRARLDNTSGKLRPGMFVRVRVIVGERQNALMVPEESIVPQGEEFYVYRVVDGAARRVPVKIGVRRGAMVEVVQGLAAGDQVVTAGMRLSRDGQPVRVQAPGEGLPTKGDAGKGEAPKGSDGKQAAEPAAVQGASKS